MSISPPTDIVLDVARAADPVRAGRATARLEAMAGTDAAPDFGKVIDAIPAGPSPAPAAASPPRNPPAAQPGKAGTYQAFEAMVLTTFVETMLPAEGAAFGSGTAGDMWRSLLAQQVASEIARSGGVGIAATLGASAAQGAGPTDPAAVTGSVVNTAERGFLAAVRPHAADTATTA